MKQAPPDFDVFMALWNAVSDLKTPFVHVRISRWLLRRWEAGDRRLLLMAFRSCGKSTLVGLFAAWLLLREPNLRILVLAADLALAKKMVRNVKRIVERHPLTRHLKPARLDQWAAEQFTVVRPLELRDPSMLARGIGANITGSRADVVICDDIEVPNTCDTPGKRDDLRQRLKEMEFVLTPGGLQLYVGTPHSFDSLYAREAGDDGKPPFLAGFRRLEIPILDRDGRSAWAQRYPPERIEAIRRQAGPNRFASQMMLQPTVVAEGRLNPELLQRYDHDIDYSEAGSRPVLRLGGKRLVTASCWWDPAFAAVGCRGDSSVVAIVYGDGEGGCWLHRIAYLSANPALPEPEAVQQCRQVAAILQELHLPAITLETNGIGAFLPAQLRHELSTTGVAAVVHAASSHRPKHLRILEGFDAVLAAGALHAHAGVWQTPFIREMREWRPGNSRGHDDGLDAVASALSAQPVRFGQTGRPAKPPDWRPGGGQHTADIDWKL